MEFFAESLWYASWPIIIIASVKFVELNLKHYKKMERLEELELLYGHKHSEE